MPLNEYEQANMKFKGNEKLQNAMRSLSEPQARLTKPGAFPLESQRKRFPTIATLGLCLFGLPLFLGGLFYSWVWTIAQAVKWAYRLGWLP